MKFELFKPGELVNLPVKIEKKHPKYRVVKVQFPSRIHMTPIDCNRFDFGLPGGGGYGFAIDVKNNIEIAFTDKNNIIAPDPQIAVVQHFIHIMRTLFNYDGNFKVKVTFNEIMHQHFGLGSTAVLSCATVWAINKLFDTPLTKNQCREIVTWNFAEGCNGLLTRGLDTGVGTYVTLFGGFVVVGDKSIPIFSTKMPKSFHIILFDCESKRPDSDLPESMEMLNRSRELDSYYRYFKSYIILMDIIPSIIKGDWKQFGNLNWEFQFAGTHLSMLQGYEDHGIKIISTLTHLHNAGALLVGMSSVGPAVYAVTENPDLLISKSKNLGMKYQVFNPCNEGVVDELIQS